MGVTDLHPRGDIQRQTTGVLDGIGNFQLHVRWKYDIKNFYDQSGPDEQ